MKISHFFLIFMVSTNTFTMFDFWFKPTKISDQIENIIPFADVDLNSFEINDARRHGVRSATHTQKCPLHIFTNLNNSPMQSISRSLINNGLAIANDGLSDLCKEMSPNNNISTELYHACHGLSKSTLGTGVAALGYTVQAGQNVIKLAQQHPQEACAVGFIVASVLANQYNNCSSCKSNFIE